MIFMPWLPPLNRAGIGATNAYSQIFLERLSDFLRAGMNRVLTFAAVFPPAATQPLGLVKTTAFMKRFFIFSACFPPLALVVYVTPLLVTEGVPNMDFQFTLLGLAYMFAIVPAWIAAGVDQLLSARQFHVVATMAVAAVMIHLLARYLGDPMDHQEIILVALTGAIPGAVCSWISDMNRETKNE